MKDAVLQMVVTYADKDMLTQAYKQLEWKGYAQMIIDLCRRECGYKVDKKSKPTTKHQFDILFCTKVFELNSF